MRPIYSFAELYGCWKAGENSPDLMAYQTDAGFKALSTEEVLNTIKYLTLGLRQMGVKQGDMVGILAGSSPLWTIADVAIGLARAVSVPLFANISHENYEFEMKQTEMRTLFVSGKEQWEMYEKHKDQIEVAISLYDEELKHDAHRFVEILELGRAIEEKDPELFDRMLAEVRPNDLASIVYTSGSTGIPKGVMLTQHNLLALAHVDPFGFSVEKDLYLNILPLAHIFGRTVNYIVLAKGVSVYYLGDIHTVANVCRELHPTMIVLVPRLLEKIYAKMVSRVQNSGFLKRMVGSWAFDLANNEHDDSLYKHIMHGVADKVVYGALRDALGGKLRIVLCGGAALNPHLYHFYLDIGLPLYEGWGMTESCPIGLNLPGKIKIGTVGPCFEGMEVKIGPDDEILIKGPNKMIGYYKNPEETKKVLDEEGWLHTGDRGKIDEDGYMTILGRIKELYKLSTGKFIAPVPIEQNLMKAPLIDMAMVIVEGKSYVTCLLFPDLEVLEALKKEHAKDETDEDFLKSPFIKEKMQKLLNDINSHVSHWEEVRDYRFVTGTPSVETGELTPTMKLRRDFVCTKYCNLIDSMYKRDEKGYNGSEGGE